MGSKKSRRRKRKAINRVYESERAAFSIFKSPAMENAVVSIVGEVACPLCPRVITQADADSGDVLALMGATATWVHIEHFYRRGADGRFVNEPVSEYQANMERLSLVHAINEGLIDRKEG